MAMSGATRHLQQVLLLSAKRIMAHQLLWLVLPHNTGIEVLANGYSFVKEHVRFSRLTPLPQHGGQKNDTIFENFLDFFLVGIPDTSKQQNEPIEFFTRQAHLSYKRKKTHHSGLL